YSEIDLPGEPCPRWYQDASASLVGHTHEVRDTLYRLDLETGELSKLDTARGTIGSADVRPDGTVEYAWSSAAEPAVIRALYPDGTDGVLFAPEGDPIPGSVDLEDAFVPTGSGGTVHALIAPPAGAPDGPLPA